MIENNELIFPTDVTFLVGENGVGKSTILESIAIAYGFNPEGGTKNFNFHTNNTHSKLSDFLVLSRNHLKAEDGFFYRAESFYNVSTNIDEPEAALSPSRLMTLICLVNELVGKDSQFIIATHSPILMAFPNATIYTFDEDGFRTVKLEDTEHYIITKAFMNNYKGMISHLI